MKKLTALSLIFILVFISGCTYDQYNYNKQKEFVGIIEIDPPKDYKPYGCGYCFTSDDGKYKCALLGTPELEDLGGYLGKRVKLYGKEHEGPVLTKCPVQIDVEKIEIIE